MKVAASPLAEPICVGGWPVLVGPGPNWGRGAKGPGRGTLLTIQVQGRLLNRITFPQIGLAQTISREPDRRHRKLLAQSEFP